MSDLLPIETAPKDGSPIIVYCERWRIPCEIVRWGQTLFGSRNWFNCKSGERVPSPPTHWMPLPVMKE